MSSPDALVRVLEQLIIFSSVCEPCLAALTGLSVGEVGGALHRLIELLTIAASTTSCDRCGRLATVFGLNPKLRPL